MSIYETIIFGCLALTCATLSVIFLRNRKRVMSICFGLFVVPLVCLSGYNWRLALIDSGKNPAWLGFSRYPFALITLLLLVMVALFSIITNILQFFKET